MDQERSLADVLLSALGGHDDPEAAAAAVVDDGAAMALGWRRLMTDYEAEVLDRRGSALRLLEVLYMACWTVGTLFERDHVPAAQAADDVRVAVLRQLWGLSMESAGEVLTLLRFGYPHGAMARWRHLREAEVISLFIASHDRDVAEAYEQHAALRGIRGRRDYQRWARQACEETLSHQELRQMDAAEARMLRPHPEWEGDYGWAHEALLQHGGRYPEFARNDKRRRGPTFSDLERALGSGHDRIWFRIASESVHLTLAPSSDAMSGLPQPEAIDTIAQLVTTTLWVPVAALLLVWPTPVHPDEELTRQVQLLRELATSAGDAWTSPPTEDGDPD